MATKKKASYSGRARQPAKRVKYSEEEITAIQTAINEENLSVRQASQRFNIPYTTLQNKLSGKTAFETKMGPSGILTNAEEQVLVNFIEHSQKRAIPVTKEKLLDAVQNILQDEINAGVQRERPSTCRNFRPGREWFRLFCKRNPQITFRYDWLYI